MIVGRYRHNDRTPAYPIRGHVTARTIDGRAVVLTAAKRITRDVARMSDKVTRMSDRLEGLPDRIRAFRERQAAIRDAQAGPVYSTSATSGYVRDANGARVRPMTTADLNTINAAFWKGRS